MNRRRHLNALENVPSNHVVPFLICCVCFLGGCLCSVWYVSVSSVPESAVQYLTSYRQRICSDGAADFSFLAQLMESSLLLILTFLAGFSMTGMVLVPALAFIEGFLLTYVASAFFCVFGSGYLASLFLLVGISAFFTLPCFFIIAVGAFRTSLSLFYGAVFRNFSEPVINKSLFLRFAVCLITAAVSAALSRFLIQHYIFSAFSF